jgi:hypothetical protein
VVERTGSCLVQGCGEGFHVGVEGVAVAIYRHGDRRVAEACSQRCARPVRPAEVIHGSWPCAVGWSDDNWFLQGECEVHNVLRGVRRVPAGLARSAFRTKPWRPSRLTDLRKRIPRSAW